MTKIRLLIAPAVSAVIVLTAGTTVQAQPSDSVPASVTAGRTPRMTTVLVSLRERADLSGVRGGRKARLRDTIDVLRGTASTSQRPLRARLRTLASRGEVADITPLWVLNAVSVTATPTVVAELARRSDVRTVTPDDVDLVPAAGPATANQAAIGAPAVWDLGHTGQGVVVATLDSGVDVTHPDLADRWRGGGNSWFDPYGQHATPTDLTGHGTGVTGLMVGGDAGGTSIGTAPGATWIAARVFDDSGAASATAVHQAFQWVLDPDHDPATADAPRVVNGSWSIGSGPGCDLSFQPDVRALRSAGILPVFAAGNFGPGTSSSVSPANYPESLSVGAVSATNLVYSASGRGPSTCGGRARVFPDVVAPGVGVTTTDRYGLYQSFTGTSAAAPHAAGVLALLLGSVPGLTADRQQQALLDTAHDLGASGPDDTYGAGLVDAPTAWQSVQPPPPSPDFTLSVSPASATVVAGDPATYDVTVAPVDGFTGDVALALAGLDAADGTWTATPAVVTGASGTARLVVDTTTSAATGTRPLAVTATSGTLAHDTPVTLEVTAPPPPPPPPDTLWFSTLGPVNPAGVGGTADDADVYRWDGATHARAWDASTAGVPNAADVDGYSRVDATHAFLSFTDRVTLPRPGPDLVVEDEDVVAFAAGTWSLWFDGSTQGLPRSVDVVGTSVVGGALFLALDSGYVPPGAGPSGSGDDADVYRWNGAGASPRFTRVLDATAAGVPAAATVDGLDVDQSRVHLSFSNATVTLPGLGTNGVQDEDVVTWAGGAWSTYFDGTAHGLGGSADLDVDAFDLP
jgi:subtilisin family serine protease